MKSLPKHDSGFLMLARRRLEEHRSTSERLHTGVSRVQGLGFRVEGLG